MKMPTIRPVGVGQLLVVKQKLLGYRAGEISHIENVQAKETRERVHRTLQQVEETETLETSTESESLRDIQSTERFEMENEISRMTKSETSFNAGLDVSGSFGPVTIAASAKFATSNSKEESEKQASKYAKELTSRATEKLVEKARRARTIRRLNEVREKNFHGFANAGETNFSGIYCWVDKYYRNKIVDYGQRLFYEFTVPEPASFYVFATMKNLLSKNLPVKPTAPVHPDTGAPLQAVDIDRENYLGLVASATAEGVEAPPPHTLIIAKSFSRDLSGDWSFSNEELKVPKGYIAQFGEYAVSYTLKDDDGDKSGYIQIGTRCSFDLEGPFPDIIDLRLETDTIPISGSGYGILTFVLNVEVNCDLSPEAFQRWQLKTYAAIMAAYQKELSTYEDKVAAAQLDVTAQLGSSPELNREVERAELKRGCITLWAQPELGSIDGLKVNTTADHPKNYPEIDVLESRWLAQQVEFFEESFDWANITYELMPYYWGRKTAWLDLHQPACADPLFERFLRAGAARVRVPVKPAEVERVLFFQLTGTIWSGGPVPALSTTNHPDASLYMSYLDELAGATIATEDPDRPVDITKSDLSTWTSKVPTSLVWLPGANPLPFADDET